MARRTTRTTTRPTFPNRVFFNWGYHDAAACVRNGWNTRERNFGFGLALNITCPEDVTTRHPNPAYACGWKVGYHEALRGASRETSQEAWQDALDAGMVSE